MNDAVRHWRVLAQSRAQAHWEPRLRAMAEDAARDTVCAALICRSACESLSRSHGDWRQAPFRALLPLTTTGSTSDTFESIFRLALRWHGSDAVALLFQDMPVAWRTELSPQTQGLHDYVNEVMLTLGRLSLQDTPLERLAMVPLLPNGMRRLRDTQEDLSEQTDDLPDADKTCPDVSLQWHTLPSGLKVTVRAYRIRTVDGGAADSLLVRRLEGLLRTSDGHDVGLVCANLYCAQSSSVSSEEFRATARYLDKISEAMAEETEDRFKTAEELFHDAALLHIGTWEVGPSLRGTECAGLLLGLVTARAYKLAQSHVHVCMDVHPYEFPQLDYTRAEESFRREYLQAVQRITQHLHEIHQGALFDPQRENIDYLIRWPAYEHDHSLSLAELLMQSEVRPGNKKDPAA